MVRAQLAVTANNNPAALAGLLAGTGVTISNATMNCPNGASGTFNGAASNIGVTNGVLLTSGSVAVAPGPNNSSSAGISSGVIFNDPQLVAIDPTAYYDPCILEFDAVPTCTTMSFTFVFGSDEYHDFVNTACNDVFGIFITGANPSGPAYNNYNMALIPATTTPISINTVNDGYTLACNATGPCTNCAYFVDNCGGATVQYDGFTTAITVNLNVVACASYHLKLAISDACDGIYDSGVFFKAASLTCNITAITATTSSTPSLCTSNNGTATANASGGTAPYTYTWAPTGQTGATATGLPAGNYTVTVIDATGCFSTTATVTVPGTGSLTLSSAQVNASCFGGSNGSATANVTSGTPAYTYAWGNGQTTSVATGLSAGNYSVVVSDGSGCSSTLNYTLTEPAAITATTTSTTEICNQQNGTASVSSSGGSGTHTYSWSNGQNGTSATGLAAGNYSVTVTDGNGCTYVAPVTVNASGGSTALAGTDASICTGASTQLNGSGGGNYSWSPAAGLSNSAIANPVANPGTTTTYTLIVTDANGCTSFDEVIVTVNPLPTPNAGPDISICNGAGAQINGSGGGNYLWSPAGSLSNANISNPVASPAVTTTYTLTVTDANGCVNTDSVIVTVNALPVAAFTVTTVCFNNPTLFNDQSTGGPVQWAWSFGDGNTSILQNPSHTYNAAGTYTATLVAISAGGCMDSVSVNVLVYPLPIASFSATTVCMGNPTCFTDLTTISPGSIAGWSWNFGDPNSGTANISNAQHPCHTYTSAGTFNVLLTATSSDGCQSTTNQNITVNPPPVAAFTANTVCLNTPTAFTDGSSSAISWSWNFGDGGTSAQQNPQHTYLGYGTYIVTLIVSSGGNCTDTILDTVTVNPVPVVAFNADSVCVGDTTSFTDLSFVAVGSIASWNWTFGDGSASTAQHPSHVYASAGNYIATLTVVSNTGCTSVLSKPVVVHSLPVAGFSVAPGNLIGITDVAEFTDLSAGNVIGWSWWFGDGSTSNQQNPSHHYGDTGIYIVTLAVMNAYGCVDTIRYPVEVQDYAFYIPNAFTPNGDDKNDFFFGAGVGILEYELMIFDRWGNRIFYCKVNDLPQSIPCRWNGRVDGDLSNERVQQDVYAWKVRLKNIFKNNLTYVGHVSVVR